MMYSAATMMLIDASSQVTSGISATGFVQSINTVPEVIGAQAGDQLFLSTFFTTWHLDQYFPFFSGLNDVQICGILFGVLIWILTIIWVLRDALARSEHLGFHFFAVMLVTVFSPIVGLPLYLAFRPLVYKRERGYWREAMTKGVGVCPHCGSLVDDTHNACVFCGESLKTLCRECHHKYHCGYAYCPECGAPNLG